MPSHAESVQVFTVRRCCCSRPLSIVLLTATIYTYDRLTAETLIAELRFDATGRAPVRRASANRRSVRRAHVPRARGSVARRRRVPEVEVLGAAARPRFAVPARSPRRALSVGRGAELATERRARLERAHGRRSRGACRVARLVEFPARRDVRQLDLSRHRRRQHLLRLPHARRASSRGTSRGPCSRRAASRWPSRSTARAASRRCGAASRRGPTTASSPRSISSINRPRSGENA